MLHLFLFRLLFECVYEVDHPLLGLHRSAKQDGKSQGPHARPPQVSHMRVWGVIIYVRKCLIRLQPEKPRMSCPPYFRPSDGQKMPKSLVNVSHPWLQCIVPVVRVLHD